jgi:hypothetical protein
VNAMKISFFSQTSHTSSWATVACLLLSFTACSSDDTAGTTNGGSTGASTGGAGGTGGRGTTGGGGAGGGTGGNQSTDAGPDASAGSGGSGGLAGAAGSAGAAGAGGTDIVDAAPERFDTDDGSIPPDAALGSCSSVNWIVTASSSSTNPNNPPLNAIDGTLATRWSTGAAQGPGQFFEIDFGGYVQVSQITLNSSGSVGDYPRGYQVEVSTDDVDFSRVIAAATVDIPPVGDLVTIDFPIHSARFLRIEQTGVAGNWWSIHELGLTCRVPTGTVDPLACGGDAGVRDAGSDAGDGATPDPFARANWTATTVPASDSGTNLPSNAFDGDIATRWTSGAPQAGNESFTLDLGSVGCISQVLITTAGADFPSAYLLGLSVDNVNFTTMARGSGTNFMQIVFPAHLARYVRIQQTGTSATNFWSINELQVLP